MARCFYSKSFARSLPIFAFTFILAIAVVGVGLRFFIPDLPISSLSEIVPALDAPPSLPLIDGGFDVEYKYSVLGRTSEDSLEAYFEFKNNSSTPLYLKVDGDTGLLDSWTTNDDGSFANISFSSNLVTREIPPFQSVTFPAPLTPTHFRPDPQPFVLELDYYKVQSGEPNTIKVKVRKQRVFKSPEINQSGSNNGGL